MLLSIIVPLLYAAHKDVELSDRGLNKLDGKSFKNVLFYIPFVVALIPLIVFYKKGVSNKVLLVQLFFYFCAANSCEVYLRSIVQYILRPKFKIIPLVIIGGFLAGFTYLFYFNRITNIKHIAVIMVAVIGFSGVATMAIERKGSIVFLVIADALYFFFATSNIYSGKKLVLGVGISLVILFVYGMLMLIPYIKENKPKIQEVEDNKQEFNENGDIEL